MKLYWPFISILLVTSIASTLQAQPTKEAKQNFQKHYQAYQACVKSSDKLCARKQAKATLELAREIFDPAGKNVAILMHNYGVALKNDDSDPEHIAMAYGRLVEALELTSKSFGPESEQALFIALDILSTQSLLATDEERSDEYALKAAQISSAIYGEDSLNHANTLKEIIISTLLKPGYDGKIAEAHAKQALALFTKHLGNEHLDTAYVHLLLGKYYYASNQEALAIKHLQPARQFFGKINNGDNEFSRDVIYWLSKSYGVVGEHEKALKLCLAYQTNAFHKGVFNEYPLNKQAPRYPIRAIKRALTGSATIIYSVNEKGEVVNPRPLKWTGSKLFIEPSMDAIKKFKYCPRIVDGQPVVTDNVENRFTFDVVSG